MSQKKIKQTKGMIPKDWEVEKIGEVTEQIFSGGTPDTRKPEYWNGDIPWLSSGETGNRFVRNTEKKITELGVKNSSTSLAKIEDVVVASAGQGHTRGQASFCMIDTYINQSIIALRSKKERLVPLFLFYNLLSRYPELRGISDAHSSRGSLTTKLLADLNIEFPSSPKEQEDISNILFNIDSKIEVNQQMNKTLEELGNAMFMHWFVNFEFPDENNKPYKSSGGDMIFNEEVGKEIPKGWKVKHFSEVIEVNPKRELQKGKTGKKVSMTDLNPWQSWIENWVLENYKSGPKFKNGDTLFARITPSLENGKTAIVSILDNDNEVGFGSTEFIVFSKKIISSNAYIFHLCRTEEIRNVAITSMTGTSGRQRVPNDFFNYLSIVVPPSTLIDEFEKLCSPMFNSIFNNANEIKQLSQIRDSLLPKLISGKIRVPVEVRK